MSNTPWYYAQAGQQRGPVPTAAIAQMLAQNQLSPTDLVWREGLGDWQPASSFPELFPAAPTGAVPNFAQPVAPLTYQGYPAPGSVGQSFSGNATTALIFSILGLTCCGLLGIVGIVLSNNALNGMKLSGNYQGQGLATAARVIGIIDLVLMVLMVIVKFGMLALR